MAQVGAGMRAVRERLGWKLPDVADELRIRLPYLEAIERGDLASLPGPAYQTGFVRSYAQVLGLDAEEILRRFRAEGGMVTAAKAELSFLAPVPDRAVPTNAIVLLCVVVLAIGYGAWYWHTDHDRRLPAELAPLAVPPKPPALQPTPVVVTKPAPAAQTAPAAATKPASLAPVATKPAPVAPPPAPPSQVITATADTWVEVQDATGNILFSKTMHAGDSWPVPEEPGLVMTAGNAGGTEITIGGKAGAALGATGTVLRGYALTPPAAGATAAPGATPAPAAATPAATSPKPSGAPSAGTK